MIRKKHSKKRFQNRAFVKANHQIKYPEVRVLTEYGDMVGVMPTREALIKAQQAEKDLVLVTENAKPPVVKIIDLAKFKYQQQQKKAEGRKKAKKQDLKEIRLSLFIGEGDFETRLRKIKKFLEKGDKVRINVEFRRGRQLTKKEFGYEMLDTIFKETEEIADIEIPPKMMGHKLMAQIMPKKKIKKQDEIKEEQ